MELQTKLSFSLIFEQSRNFLCNRMKPITLVCLALAVINNILTGTISIDEEAIKNLYLGHINSTISLIIMFTLMIGIILKAISIAMISNLYTSDRLNLNLLLSKALSNLLNIILFYLFIFVILLFAVLIVSMGIFILKMLLPTAILSILMILIVFFSIIFIAIFSNFFFGLLVNPNNRSFMELINLSLTLSKQHWKPALLMLLTFLAFELILAGFGLLFGAVEVAIENLINSHIVSILIDIMLFFFAIMLDTFIVIFFYRLYSLATGIASPKVPPKNDENNKLIV
ncbi:hypothetical protein [Gilliamella sp. WF3-4]|uniref:hypothetical protein n=1 Tax=Gilliamella sp. WF3-4 TaxID=3120255 RepID=UPI00080DE1FD|nr:hypothetical protein [Gilliamella apicola]OCG17867.1 hypothetical protein A9G47_07710 [Gilliamella apicola]